MSTKVSLFSPVKIGDFNYLFFVVCWNDYYTAVKDEVRRQLDAFGADLGTTGNVLQPYDSKSYATAQEILAKNWPKEFGQRLDQDTEPFMLIIKTDFGTFDPQEQPWGVIWFSEYAGDAKDITHLFHKLAVMSRKNEDIFDYLHALATKKRISQAAEVVKHATKYFEIKPQVFGISVDVKAIVEDLLDAGLDSLERSDK